ncbi:Ribosomal large subunit pseudouridine(746) synthase @ tRNA pseudouridine(32) synthase [hydrothermal vent metagenome]|uniref:Ribosomal large subunit pseudouridine(746) synthase @ tRNA pseudouridine(32) synthase n=1 Tax=hydrothermal vent metagenome TaxID=652676 RepID=A0A3B0YXA2_9ZZZZ
MKEYCPPDTCLDIQHIDEALLVVNKPSGLLSVPGRGEDKQDCLLSRLQTEYPEALSIHRLDMDTSGLILFARNKKIHRQMSQLFEQRQVHKTYDALVSGCLQGEGIMDYPLLADWPNRPRQKVDFMKGKEAITRWQTISSDHENNTSHVKLFPVTGRSHQLRVHLYSLGYPILGDNLYFSNHSDKKAKRLMLHACQLSFIHPLFNSSFEMCLSSGF